ncbi:MAG: PF20097 family protein [Chloroflexota bacterium]
MVQPKKTINDYPCPQCGQEMEKGYVLGHHSIRWAIDEKQGSQFAIAAEALSPIPFWENPRLPALRCRQCDLVIFQY